MDEQLDPQADHKRAPQRRQGLGPADVASAARRAFGQGPDTEGRGARVGRSGERWGPNREFYESFSETGGVPYYPVRIAGEVVHWRGVRLPERIYKHTSRRVAKLICEQGSLRLRPLAVYQAYEARDAAVGDSYEGQAADFTVMPPEVLRAMDERLIEHGVVMFNYTAHDYAPHTMVWCLSSNFSPDVARRFGTDAIVEVPNAKHVWLAVVEATAKALGMLPERFAAVPVQAIGHVQEMGRRGCEVEPFLRKRPAYAWQDEFRLAMVFPKVIELDQRDAIGAYLDVEVSKTIRETFTWSSAEGAASAGG